MQNNLERMLAKIYANKAKRQRSIMLVSMLSLIIVLGVFWQLMQPVITRTADPVCGIAVHSHSSDCYADQLICGLETGEMHEHSSGCYQPTLLCGISEHSHTDGCYPVQLPEVTLPPVVTEEPSVSKAAEVPAEPTATPVPEITATPMPEVTATPVPELTATPVPEETSTPVPELTATPVPELTATPVPELTATPVPELTAAPVPELTATPVPEVSAAPVPETTQEVMEENEPTPTPEVTEEPTLAPAATSVPPVELSAITVSAADVLIGEEILLSFECGNAEKLTYAIIDESDAIIASGDLQPDQRQFSWVADRTGIIRIEITAENECSSLSNSVTVAITAPAELTAAVYSDKNYCFAGDEISFYPVYSGGMEPVSCNILIMQGDAVLAELNEWTQVVTATTNPAENATMITAQIALVDASGAIAVAESTVPCPVYKYEEEWQWAASAHTELSAEWPADLVAVAKTQIGYKESQDNFIIDENGTIQGYTRYGDWYGSPYEEWCAMYASFCLNYAEIPEKHFPREASCVRWAEKLIADDLYAAAGQYDPQAGDLVFFDWENDGRSDHVGIISKVTDCAIHTIEGNSGKAVRCNEYAISDKAIAGYGLISKAYNQYSMDNLSEEEPTDNVIIKAVVTVDVANLREAPTTESKVLDQVKEGQELCVLGEEQVGEWVWYQVLVSEQTGYLRGDLLMLLEPEADNWDASAEPESTEAPTQDNFAILWSELETLAISGAYTSEQLLAVEERAMAAYEVGYLAEAEYEELLMAIETLLYAYSPMTLDEVDSGEVGRASRYAVNSVYGWELSLKFIPVDSDGNVRSDVAAPDTVRHYFSYTDWSSYKAVKDNCSAITNVLSPDEIIEIDLINMNTGAKHKDADYVKINSRSASASLYCGASSSGSKAISGTDYYYYMAVYYKPAEMTLIFTDDAGNTLATVPAVRGSAAIVPDIEGYAFNTRNNEGKYLTGWQTADGAEYGESISNIQSNMTLFPVWSDTGLGSCNLTFVVNDTQTQISAFIGQEFGELVAPDAAMDGYRFDGWFDENGVQYAAETAIAADVTLYARYTELIDISFIIDNQDYTSDPESGYTHVTVKNTEGLSTDGFNYEMVGTGDRYRVFGTGTMARVTIPAGESLSDNDLTLISISVENQFGEGGTGNKYTYVSPYSWVSETGMVCSADTVFDKDTVLYLRLYASDEKYHLNYVCCENCASSISYALSEAGLSYPHPTIGVGESIAAEFIPSSADVNTHFICDNCGYGATYRKVLDHWYILDQDGRQIMLEQGVTIQSSYLPAFGDTITVYAVWKDAPNNLSVTFRDADGTVLSADSEAPCYSTFGSIKPANPEKDGCSFIGWTADGGKTLVADSTVVSADADYTAVYDAAITVKIPDDAAADQNNYIIRTLTVRTGRQLSDATDAEGNGISAELVVNGSLFTGWLVEGDFWPTTDLSNYLVTGAMTVTAQYEKAIALTFCYQTAESDEVITAETLYVRNGGTLYDAVDASGNPANGAFPTLQVPGYSFNHWMDVNGNQCYPSYNSYTADTVYTANLTRLSVVSFQELDFADADSDGDTTDYITTCCLYVNGSNALGTAIDANGAAVDQLPAAFNTPTSIFRFWSLDGQTPVTMDAVITGDTVITAVYETAPVVTFTWQGTQYQYTVEQNSAFAAVLAQAASSETNPLPLEEIMADQDIMVDGQTIRHQFSGWYYRVVTDNLEYVNVPASDDLAIIENIEFIAGYSKVEDCTVVLHDIGPDGREQGDAVIDLLIPCGDAVAGYLADQTLPSDGACAADVIWYAMIEDGSMVPFDAAQPLTGDLELYTYTYQIVLTVGSAQTASVLDLLMPAAYAEVEIENGQLIVTFRDGETLSKADFVKDGVDYTLYSWSFNNASITSIDSLISYVNGGNIQPGEQITGTGTAPSYTTTQQAIAFKAYVDGAWKTIKSESMTAYYLTNSSNLSYYYLTAAQLEHVYAPLGFKASDICYNATYTPFAFREYEGHSYDIWLDASKHLQQNGTWFARINDYTNTLAYVVYYMPGGTTAAFDYGYESIYTADPEKHSVDSNLFHSITVKDEDAPIAYVRKTGSVTLEPRDGNIWKLAEGYENSCTLGSDGLTISNATSAIVIEPAGDVFFDVTITDHADKVFANTLLPAVEPIQYGKGVEIILPNPPVEYEWQISGNATVTTSSNANDTTTYRLSNVQSNISIVLTKRPVYTVIVTDPLNLSEYANITIPAEALTPLSVLAGNSATVVLPTLKLESGFYWHLPDDVVSNERSDGYTEYTFNDIRSDITVELRSGQEMTISYDINCPNADTAILSEKPQIEGGNTFTDTAYIADHTQYIVKVPSQTSYNINGNNSFVVVTFNGWFIDANSNNWRDADETLFAPGQVLTADELNAHSDGIQLLGSWTNQGYSGSVSFYINLELRVADYDGSTEDTPNSNYTGAVYGTKVTIDPYTSYHNYADVLQAPGQAATAAIDKQLRQLVNGVDASYQGLNRTFTLDSFPDDETVLAKIRSMQDDYISEFKNSSFYNPNDPYNVADYRAEVMWDGHRYVPKYRIISQNDKYVPSSELTSDNYTVRWYVFKYDNTNGWHIDGVLVKKQGYLTITKSFYGNDAAVENVKQQPYSISIMQSNDKVYELNLTDADAQDNGDYTSIGYTSYDAATDTYTWAIALSQGATYTLFENNYEAPGSIEIGGLMVPMASLPEYMVTNTNGDDLVRRTTYKAESGVTVRAEAYSNDLNHTNFKTVKFYNSYIPTNSMLLSKVDDNGTPLGNVAFQLKKAGTVHPVWKDADGVYYIYDPTATIAATQYSDGHIVTDAMGYAMIIGLKDQEYAGSYSLSELEAPPGYSKIDEEISFTVGEDGGLTLDEHPNAELVDNLTLQVTNTSHTIDVTARKIWTDNTNKEVQVALCMNGTPMSSYTATLNAENNWEYIWEDIPAYIGSQMANYTLREAWIGDTAYSGTIDDGYADYVVTYDNPVYTYDDEGKPSSLTLTVRNRTYTGGVEFTKVDENGQPLSGAVFTMYSLYTDETCQNQYGSRQQSDKDGKVSFGNLAAGTYYLKETAAPNGYLPDETVYKLVVSGSGSTITRVDDDTGTAVTAIRNYPSSAELTVRKVDGNGNPLTGATFRLNLDGKSQPVNGTDSANFTPDGDNASYTIADLASSDGIYTITETAAPAGYYGMEGAIAFKITAGEVVVDAGTLPEGVVWNANTLTFTVMNTPGVELPSTGGSGTLPYTIGGLSLMAISLLCGIGHRRKRERGQAN